MREHAWFEELAALAAGGHLSPNETSELRAHLASCAQCRQDALADRDLVTIGLPLARDAESADAAHLPAIPPPGIRDRFLARAAREGVPMSGPGDRRPEPARRLGWRPIAAGLAAAAVLAVAVAYAPRLLPRDDGAASETVARLTRANAELHDALAARTRDLDARDARLHTLQAQLDRALADVRRNGRQGRSASQPVRLVDELQNRDTQLAAAADEIRRINQLRAADRATLDTQAARLREAFDQLRIANATLDMERQLAAAGKDILELLLAKQLRVVDVRDTDATGRPTAAFARVFIAENRTVRIFAFDLNEGRSGPSRFEVWGEGLGGTKTARSLGVLNVDDRTQNRWSATIHHANVTELSSVFVTASGGADGPRLLYAFLDAAGAP
jgi:hypothetical protein